MFQEIGECMTEATVGIGSIHDVLSRASWASVFFFRQSFGAAVFFSLSLPDCDILPTLHRAQMSHVKKNLAYTKSLMRWKN